MSKGEVFLEYVSMRQAGRVAKAAQEEAEAKKNNAQ